MKLMEDLILQQGEILPGGILKIDSIINHMFNPWVMDCFGAEFKKMFGDLPVHRVLTAEVSGIALAYPTAREYGVNVVYARKKRPVTMRGKIIIRTSESPTKGGEVDLMVSADYLRPGQNVLIIDDFLASGETAVALGQIVEDAGANPIGFGFAVEKSFQGGRETIRQFFQVPIVSLAIIREMTTANIEFER